MRYFCIKKSLSGLRAVPPSASGIVLGTANIFCTLRSQGSALRPLRGLSLREPSGFLRALTLVGCHALGFKRHTQLGLLRADGFIGSSTWMYLEYLVALNSAVTDIHSSHASL